MATELEVITSLAIMERVAGKLDLARRWVLPPDQVVDALKDVVTVQQLRNTDLIEIRARHTMAADARDIADMVARQYAARRTEMGMARAREALDALDAELKAQEDKVAEKRKVLDRLVQAQGGSYSTPQPHREELEREKEQLDGQIESLRNFRGENLFRYAAGGGFRPVS